MCGLCQERKILFLQCFQLGRNTYILGQLTNGIYSSLTIGCLIHLVYTFHSHSTSDLTILFTGAVSIVLHNDGEHHCAGYTMRGIIDSTQSMCHGMGNTKTYVGEAHTCNVLAQSHAFTAFLGIGYSAAQGLGNDLDCLQVEHIGHLPCRLGGVTFDSVGQSIHTGRSGQSLGHRRHHLGIYHSDDGHVMRIYTDEFTLTLYIGDNVVDRNLSCGTGCGGYCDDGYTGFLGRCYAFQAAYIFEFRVGNDDTDGFGGIHGRTTTDGDDIICTGCLESSHTVFHIVNSRISLNIGINFISKTFLVKQSGYFSGHTELDQVGIGTYECLLKSMSLCFGYDFCNCSCTVIRGLVEHNSVCHDT